MFEIKLQTEATRAIFRLQLLQILRLMLLVMMLATMMVFHIATNDICGWFHRLVAPAVVVHDLALNPTTATSTTLTTAIAIMNTRLRWQFRG